MIRLAVILSLFLAGPAFADAASETALRDLFNRLDADPAWSVRAGDVSSEGPTTVASDVEFSRSTPQISLSFDEIRLDDLAIGNDGNLTAATARIRSLTVSTEKASLVVPELVGESLSLPAGRLVGLSTDSPVTLVGQFYSLLAQVEGASVAIPQAMLQQIVPAPGEASPITSRTTYRDIAVASFRGGIVERTSVGATRVEQTTPDGPVTMTIGGGEATHIDIGQMARILDPAHYANGRGDGSWKTVLGEATYRDFELHASGGAVIGIARVSAHDLQARQPERPFADELGWLIANPDAEAEEVRERVLAFLPLALRSLRIGGMAVEGIAIKPEAPDPGRATIAAIRFYDMSSDGIGEVSVEGIGVTSPQATFELSRFAVRGIRFADFDDILAMIELSEGEDDAAAQAEISQRAFDLLPTFDGATIRNFAVAVGGKRLLGIGEYDYQVSGRLKRLPVAGAVKVRDVAIAAEAWRENATPLAEMLDGLGYREIAIDGDGKADWTAGDGLLDVVTEFRLRQIADIGLDYAIAGITEDWFESVMAAMPSIKDNQNPIAVLAILSPLGVRGARLTIADRSIVERAIAYFAARQGLDAETYREQLKGALPFLLGALGDPALQQRTAGALQAFLDGGHKLTISLQPEDIVLLPQLTGAATLSPAAVIELLNGDISAEKVE